MSAKSAEKATGQSNCAGGARTSPHPAFLESETMMEPAGQNGPFPQPQRQPFQYGLRGLFWLTTVVAILSALVAQAMHVWEAWGWRRVLTITVAFWPSLAVLIAWSCPGLTLAGRLRLFAAVGLGVVVIFWGWACVNEGPAAASADTIMVFVVTMLVVGVPQFLIVFGAVAYSRARSRKKVD
jgi:hypothetical protein